MISPVFKLRWGRAAFRLFDQYGEVFGSPIRSLRDMAEARKAFVARRINAVLITIPRWNDTVGRHHNCSVKCFKFAVLLPPGISVISYKMLIFLKCWIIVDSEYLTVRVHVHVGSFCLLQQFFQIVQVVAANENVGSASHPDIYLRNFRISVTATTSLLRSSLSR